MGVTEPSPGAGRDRPVPDVVTPMWRALVVLRVVLLLFAAGALVVGLPGYRHPALGVALLAVLAVWTAVAGSCYSHAWGRRLPVVLADLVLTAAAMIGSGFVLSRAQLDADAPLVTSIWAAGAVVAAGVLRGWRGGLLAGVLIAVVNVVARQHALSVDLVRDTVLVTATGFVVGLAADTVRSAQRRLEAALRAEAAALRGRATALERERLARAVHDGVLQVLIRVARRGAELAGGLAPADRAELVALARSAAEQETALRTLLTAAPPLDGDLGDARGDQRGLRDVRRGVQLLAGATVSVAVPATPVELPAGQADELVAAVREAVANTARHAGPGARAWILVEDLGEEVVLAVRDDGPGIAEGALAVAAAAGRMGVSRSIVDRLNGIGGTARLITAPGQGTEWELTVPVRREAGPGGSGDSGDSGQAGGPAASGGTGGTGGGAPVAGSALPGVGG